MRFWDKLRTSGKQRKPDISFGRFTDAYKSKDRYEAWDESLKLYEAGDYLNSVKYLLEYMKNQHGDNIIIEADAEILKFKIYHGSKQLDCSLNNHVFRAESKIAFCRELHVGFLRKTIEYNYVLNYSRYALDNANNLCMVFDSSLLDSSPYKIFYGLKELALQSDREDDILLHEFEYLDPIQNQHVVLLSPELKQIKLKFIRKIIADAFATDAIGKLNPKRYQGALTYVYLSAAYTIDYLVKPEGVLMDSLSKLHISYFQATNDSIESKVSLLENGLREIEEMNDATIEKYLYDVISTFGITSPVNHKTIAEFMDSELQVLKWYEENKHDKVSIAICNYIAGYCLYNFAMPAPDKDLFHLYFEIVEHEYFSELGFQKSYWDQSRNMPDYDAIYNRIENILKEHRDLFPSLPYAANLNENNFASFLKSFLLFIKNLNIN